MSLVTHSPLLPMLPNPIMQVSMESEQNPSVSCLSYLPLIFADNLLIQVQNSGLGLFAYAQNTLITGGTFVVSLSWGLYKQLIIVYILSARTMSIFPPPILEFLHFQNQTPVHCLLGRKMYSTSLGRFLFLVLIVN